MKSTKQAVVVLLRDYMNILPPGPQEAFVPLAGSGSSEESGWLITPELERRMDGNTLVGETYEFLDDALRRLDREHPRLYSALVQLYLHDGSGHRDVDDLRIKANGRTDNSIGQLVIRHDAAIDILAEYLADTDLYVRWPQKAPGPRPGQNMNERHNALFAVFLRYIEDGVSYRQSVRNAALKCEYSVRHAERIIKPRWKEYNEEA